LLVASNIWSVDDIDFRDFGTATGGGLADGRFLTSLSGIDVTVFLVDRQPEPIGCEEELLAVAGAGGCSATNAGGSTGISVPWNMRFKSATI